ERDGEVTRGLGRGVEVLMEQAVGWRKDAAMLPVESAQLLLAFPPVEAVALTGDSEDVEVGAVAVPLLVRTHRHLGHVRVHRAVREHEHYVPPARTTCLPSL